MTTALLLIEIQNDYFPNGRMPIEKSLDVSIKAQEVLRSFRQKQQPIVHIQHFSTRIDAAYFLPCTKGANIHPSVQPINNELVIQKHYPNSFKDTPLLSYLSKNRVTQLVIVGMMTHLAIDSTVRAAYDYGFDCHILFDACATKNLEFNNIQIQARDAHHTTLAALQSWYASSSTVKEYLQANTMRSHTLLPA